MNLHLRNRFVFAILLLFGASVLPGESPEPAMTVHVAPDGNDTNAGTDFAPLQTLPKAQQRVREVLAEQSRSTVEVILHEGTYRLQETLRFSPEDVAEEGHRVTWRAADGARVRISGGTEIQDWRKRDDGSFVATLDNLDLGEGNFRELFINGERRQRARHPDTGYARVREVAEDRRTGFTYHQEDLPEALSGDLSQSGLELVFIHDWSSSRTPVASIDREQSSLRTAAPVGPSLHFFHMDNWEAHPRYYLENHPAFLSSPGEWFFDHNTGILTYLPLEGETPDSLEAVIPRTHGLIRVRGEPGNPVRGLTFRNLHFEHSGWQHPDNGYSGIQATLHDPRAGTGMAFVPAALTFDYAENCAIEGGSLRHLGRSAVWFRAGCSNNRVQGTQIEDVAGNGIMIGESGDRRVDGSPWYQAAPEQAAAGNVIEDNLVQNCGVLYYGAVGIWVGLAADTRIAHNTLRHLPYTGISVGWMWNPSPTTCRGTVIERNHIHDVMQVLSDGGGIYTLGWQPDAVFRQNLIHSIPVNTGRAESNGMFIDEGSKGITIERNVIFDTERSPLRFHRADENLVRDNLLVRPDDDTPVFRYNTTPQENITRRDNDSPLAIEFTPADIAEIRTLVGPRNESAHSRETR